MLQEKICQIVVFISVSTTKLRLMLVHIEYMMKNLELNKQVGSDVNCEYCTTSSSFDTSWTKKQKKYFLDLIFIIIRYILLGWGRFDLKSLESRSCLYRCLLDPTIFCYTKPPCIVERTLNYIFRKSDY